MKNSTAMNTAENSQLQGKAEQEMYLRPVVDIYEDVSGITLKADLPGVSKERLDVQVDGDTLIVQGGVAIDMPEDMDATYADVNATRYRRSFTLSRELETDKVSAEIKNGELTLSVPKRAELQPRKIEISAG
jgi:HSP20 family protein